ncbi:MAG: response regulator [Oscillospiraceae bacterium]|jgi:PAS domain S-box-containing protein|nr:response regulator [Oscillospiraceae bacterium]
MTQEQLRERIHELEIENKRLTRANSQLKLDLKRSDSIHLARRSVDEEVLETMYRQGRYLEAMLQHNNEYMFIYDKSARLLRCSDSVLPVLGVSSQNELAGLSQSDVLQYFAGNDENYVSTMSEIFDTVERTGANISRDMDITLRSSGVTRYFHITYSSLKDDDGKFNGVVAVYHETTELVRAIKRAEESERAKDNFLLAISHEILTPINAVKGLSEMLSSSGSPSSQQRVWLDEILSNASKVSALLQDILEYSKMSTSQAEFNDADFDLHRALSQIGEGASLKCLLKGVEFISEINKDIPRVFFGDERKITKVIANILENAVKYTDTGKVMAVAEVEQRKAKKYLAVTIMDTGSGIAEEQMKQLFTPLKLSENIQTRGSMGAGLGLAYAQQVVEKLGGDITVVSSPGEGAVFEIWIPLSLGNPALVSEVANLPYIRTLPSVSALTVDDNPINLTVIGGFLKKHDIAVTEALSGAKALELVGENSYDLIFMDYMMPEMDGITAAKELRKIGVSAPIIALTAYTMPGAKQFFMESGLDDYLAKPLDDEMLNQILYRWLPLHKLAGAISSTGETLKVLVADDLPGGRKALRCILEKLKCYVYEAATAQETVSVAMRETPDIIFAEPAMADGYNMLQELSDSIAKQTRLITLTRDENAAKYAKSLGAVQSILKPYSAKTVHNLLMNVN